MKVPTDKIISLKAFYMGHRIRDAVVFKDEALNMINKALSCLHHQHSYKSKTRKLFYYLLLCEILRGNDDSFKYRRIAKNLASSLDKENIYSDYMAIVNETDTRPKIYGINKSIMFKKTITSYSKTLNGDMHVWYQLNDGIELPFPAIGVNPNDLSNSQVDYINSCSLKDIMSAHNINYH